MRRAASHDDRYADKNAHPSRLGECVQSLVVETYLHDHEVVVVDKVDEAVFIAVSDVGMDETSARRGQDYVSIFMDLDQRRVMFATPGKDAETVKAFAADLGVHGGRPQTQVQAGVC